jgi:parallel beta-helix repeat protein
MSKVRKYHFLPVCAFIVLNIGINYISSDDKDGLWAASQNVGKTYYVSVNGSDRNDGSINHPWGTIQHAGRTAKAGDTVLVRGGIYREGEIWLQAIYGMGGRYGQMLTIKAYPGEKPIFVNAERPFIIECDYIRIEGLNFQNGKSLSAGGINRTDIQLVGNSFVGSGYGWDAIGTSGNNILLEGNVCDIKGNLADTQGHCYYIMHGKNIIIRNNIGRGPTGYGIHIFDQRRGGDPPDFERLIKDVIVEGNIISNSEKRCGIIIAAYDHARVENVIIRNNILYNNAGPGIFIPGIAANVKVFNNTIFGNKEGAAFLAYGKPQEVSNLIIKNNIFDIASSPGQRGPEYHVIIGNKNPGFFLENNLYWPGPIRLKSISDPSGYTGDPLFVNAMERDFHLRKGSAAIDKGASLSEVPKDRDGINRPQGSAFDIGAYEFHD